MPIHNEITSRRKSLFELCKKYKVNRLFVFGSSASSNFNSDTSDIDLIAEMDDVNPVEKGENIMNLWTELEDLFSRKVDLLTSQKFRNPYLQKQVDATKQLIYDRESA